MLTKSQKVEIVKKLQEFLRNSLLSVFCNFSGIDFEKQKMLKEKFKENKIELKVVKTSLLRKALEFEGIPFEELKGPILVAFGKDEVLPAKIFYQFKKENLEKKTEKLEFVGGVAKENDKYKKLSPEDVKDLALLPTLKEAKSQLCFVLKNLLSRAIFDFKNPIQKFVFILAKRSE